MKIIVTGGAGFIGSHLVDRLMKEGHKVTVLDNLSSGKKEFLSQHRRNPKFKFIKADVMGKIEKHFKNIDEVWHLAANPDVRIMNPNVHIKQNILATKNVLEAMRKNNVKKIFFTSSSTVYGEAVSLNGKIIPTSENHVTEPISFYGAAKLSSEALIRAYCSCFDMKAIIFRFANVIGPRSTHGVIFDFMKKLKKDPSSLDILGDGNQKKSYIYINDCVDAMMTAMKSEDNVNIVNIGSEDWIDVKSVAKLVCEHMNLKPEFRFTGGDRGWKGDVPLMILSINKIRKLGWKPQYDSENAVKKTLVNL